nr:host specificity factor TipJ family phage tail protein [Achromobacter ruhlandii]
MVAIVVLSYGYGAALGGALGLSGTTAAAVGSSIIMIGGSLLVNALLPMPTPTAAKLGNGQKYESSPTYSIQGGRNRARPWEPMVLVFGRHKVVPDLGATPWTNQVGDDQYLNQVFNFGLQGMELNLTDFKIGSSPLESYAGVQLQRSAPDGALTMFAGNVDTLQGFALSSNDGWISRTTPPGVGTLSVEIASRLFRVQDDGSLDSRVVDFRIQYREVGAPNWIELGYIGATYATHYWSGRLLPGGATQVRMGSTNRADHADGELWYETDPTTGEDYRGQWKWVPHPYQLGQPWEGIAPDPILTPGAPGFRMWGNRQEPTRAQINWNVTDGQYEIRVMKVTPDVSDSRESNETAVSQILVHQIDRGDYRGQVRVALRIKATGQLNGSVDEFNAIASAVCPVWNGSSWSPQETSNPAWWFLWFARGKRDEGGQRLFGGGLSDAQIDVESIKAWALWCNTKSLTFDYVLDQKMSTAAVMQMIARAGRASLTYQTGKLGVVWDAEGIPVTAMFGPFNVKAGSFKVAYLNEGSVDEIVGNFVNAEKGWTLDEVRAKVPGALATNNPLQLDLDGCVHQDMAGREANLIAASQVWKRRRVEWETDIEGLVATRGDVVSFSHDLTVWGYSGRLMPGSGGTLMRLQNRVPSGGSGIVMLRDPDGNMKTVSVVSASGDVDELTITTDLDGFPMPGDPGYEDCSPLDWAWQFDPISTPGRRFKITSVMPAGDGLRFEAVDDDPEYYLCESNPYLYTPPRDGTLLAGVIFAASFTEAIRSAQNDDISAQLSWVISTPGRVQVNYSINAIAQQPITTEERQTTISAKTGDVIVATIRPVRSTGAGQPFTLTYTVQGLLSPLPPVAGLTTVFRDGLTALIWAPVVDVRNPEYEVRLGTSWTNSRTVGVTRSLDMLAVGNGTYFVAARFQLKGTTIYGASESIQISGAVLVRNVLVTVREDPGWTGVVSDGAFVHNYELTLAGTGDIIASPDVIGLGDVLWFGGVQSGGAYVTDASNIVDIGYLAPVRVDFTIDEYALNFSEDFLAIVDVLAEPDVLNGTNRQHYRVRPQIQVAGDNGVYGAWQDYVPGTINARYFNVRLVLETDDPNIVPFIRRFDWTVDVPDLLQSGTALTVSPAGTRVIFPKKFHMRPNLQVTILDAVAGDRAVVRQDVDPVLGFDIQMLNGSTPVERVINWLAQGY